MSFGLFRIALTMQCFLYGLIRNEGGGWRIAQELKFCVPSFLFLP